MMKLTWKVAGTSEDRRKWTVLSRRHQLYPLQYFFQACKYA
jgi:hypothetical protein